MPHVELIATCPMGLEAIVARELRELGYNDLQVENGRVVFKGDELAICRTNLWLRTADRILIKMGEFKATTFEALFEGTKALPWERWIPADGEFPALGRSHKSQLTSVPACQSIVKKAVVERLKQCYNVNWFSEDGPRYVMEVALLKDIATLTIDTTGASLHKRGYRRLVTEAPLKETMAAAMLLLSRWNVDVPLIDPFCGSGTIPIEAAMIGWNIAPGLRRAFPSQHWPAIDFALWDRAKEEAYDLLKDDAPLHITGFDIDAKAIEVAQAAAAAAGLSKEIKLEVAPVAKLRPPAGNGWLITNPPYGERLGERSDAEQVLRQLGSIMSSNPDWSMFILSPNKQLEHYFGKPADRKRKLYNGRIECHLYQYWASGRIFSNKPSSDRPVRQ